MNLSILEDVAAMRPHTMANKVLSPLIVEGLIKVVEYKPNGYQPKKVQLTQDGWCRLKKMMNV